jgi:hypothetical protein
MHLLMEMKEMIAHTNLSFFFKSCIQFPAGEGVVPRRQAGGPGYDRSGPEGGNRAQAGVDAGVLKPLYMP